MAPVIARSLQFPRAHPAWTTVLAFIALLVLVLALFNWNWLRGPIERMVSERTGRELRIGALDVDFFPLEVQAEKLRFANAKWSDEKTMARAERVDLRLRFWPLLRGRVDLARLELDQPFLRVERNAKGVGNWQFPEKATARKDETPGDRLRIRQLQVSKGRFELREPTFGTAIDVRVTSARPPRKGALSPLQFAGKGSYRKAPFELAGKVDSPLALQDKERPYHIDARARAGETRAHVSGGLVEPLRLQNGSVNLEMSGADLAQLYEFTGVVLPASPPYAFRGTLVRKGQDISYRKFSGTVGDSDLSGDATVHLGGKRLKLTAVLQSRVLDFDDLGGFVGATPATGAGETASAEQEQARAAQKASGKLLPTTPIELAKLRSMDADVQLTAAQINSPRLPLENMTAHLKLVDGTLRLDPLEFGAAGGRLSSIVQLDARGDPAKFGIAMRMENLELPKLLPRAKVLSDSIGTLQGALELSGEGNSTASILASSDGTVGVIMGEGRISNLVLEVAGLDIAESLKFLIGNDKDVRLRCAYADFGLEDGVATARSVAMDTTDTALLLRGNIDLGTESLDLKLLPKPKDASPISIRSPILIGGTFADPAVAPEAGPLLVRGAAVAALASIAPPLALLALIETGQGKDLNCGPDVPPSNKGKSKSKKEQREDAGPRNPS